MQIISIIILFLCVVGVFWLSRYSKQRQIFNIHKNKMANRKETEWLLAANNGVYTFLYAEDRDFNKNIFGKLFASSPDRLGNLVILKDVCFLKYDNELNYHALWYKDYVGVE